MTKANEYWFARRYPVGDVRSAMAPVHWKGWLVSLLFCAVMVLAAGLFGWMAFNDRFVQGAMVFVLLSIVGGGWFILVTQANGDRVRTVADYKRETGRA